MLQKRTATGQNTLLNTVFYYSAIAILALYFLPFWILGDQSYIQIHDNLVYDFIFLDLLPKTGQSIAWNPDAVIENMMGGLPRHLSFRSGFSITLLFFNLMDTLPAYFFNHMLVHIIGFVGMYLLLHRHFMPESDLAYLKIGLSLCFAILPLFTIYGASVSAQPLLLYAFLNLLNGREKEIPGHARGANIWNYLIIAGFPFYSYFVMVGPFLIGLLGLIWLYHLIRYRAIKGHYLAGLVLLTVVSLLVNYQLIHAFLSSDVISHRAVYNKSLVYNPSLAGSISRTVTYLLKGQINSALVPNVVLIIALFVATGISIFRKKMPLFILFSLLGILIVALGFGFNKQYTYLLKEQIPIVNSFNFSRIHFCGPLLWYIVFAWSLYCIQGIRYGKQLVVFLLVAQLALVLYSDRELAYNMRTLTGTTLLDKPGVNTIKKCVAYKNEPNYRKFKSENLFNQVKEHIGKPLNEYKVLSLGILPCVSLLNGFHTLDGFQTNYPLDYKLKFRDIIAKELDKDEVLKKLFDGRGNRCYLYSAELGDAFMYGKVQQGVVRQLELNTQAIRRLGGDYILSGVEIKNYEDLHLEFEKYFRDDAAYWEVYLYKVTD